MCQHRSACMSGKTYLALNDVKVVADIFVMLPLVHLPPNMLAKRSVRSTSSTYHSEEKTKLNSTDG